MEVNVFKYLVKSDGIDYYCKVTENILREDISYDFAFGGIDTFCFIANMEKRKNFVPYIDRVEYDTQCVKKGVLEERGGTTKLVRAALWTMKAMFEHITKFTLIDDSHINCERGVRLKKMNLAYETIFKTGQTWYEKQFHAQLSPELESSYRDSIKVIHEPITPFERIVRRFPRFQAYKEEYNASNTPQEFIHKMREKYAQNYCFEVSDWLTDYAEHLGITYYKQNWFVDANDLIEPDGYELFTSTAPIRGGRVRKTRKKYYGKPSIGYYGTFD